MDAQEIIKTLDLSPHPEGGWYRETWRDGTEPRSTGTAIYFLLEAHQNSHWHKVDATEIWHWYAGSALELDIHTDQRRTLLLGPSLLAGQEPQRIVPKEAWQRARPVDGWVLVGCTVSPGFEFDGFTLAEAGWDPDHIHKVSQN